MPPVSSLMKERTSWLIPERSQSAHSDHGTASTASVSSFSDNDNDATTLESFSQHKEWNGTSRHKPKTRGSRGSRGRGRKTSIDSRCCSQTRDNSYQHSEKRVAESINFAWTHSEHQNASLAMDTMRGSFRPKDRTRNRTRNQQRMMDYNAMKKQHENLHQGQNHGSWQSSPEKFDANLLRCCNMTAEEVARYVALDCEMVAVMTARGVESALARVTVVNWFGAVVYDQFCKPSDPVCDYRSFVSGITPEHLQLHGLPLSVIRSQVSHLLRNQILIGHALENDLAALQLTHPWTHMRDTSLFEPFQKIRCLVSDNDAASKSNASGQLLMGPRRLKDLAAEYLHREIQKDGCPHCPYEDAVAALDLYRIVRPIWETSVSAQLSAHLDRQQQLSKARMCSIAPL
jgi:RNA exonuclease 4